MAINHYQLLGIPEDADIKRVKAAYRSMAKRFHPDTNKGSEAAAELFLKINDAYRVLSDEQLRNTYNQQVTKKQQTSKQPASTYKKPPTVDPQQKFNHFLNSLLDAIFIAPDNVVSEVPKKPLPSDQQAGRKKSRKPDFNFYYYLEMERSSSPYSCDDDGIYRKNKGNTRAPPKPGSFGRAPGSNFIVLLLMGLWTFFRQ